jgi:hypothetical protein
LGAQVLEPLPVAWLPRASAEEIFERTAKLEAEFEELAK